MKVNRKLAAVASVGIGAIALTLGATAGQAGDQKRSGTIAFLRASDGIGTDTSLFVIQADGTGLRRLTPRGSRVWAHAWSPDGRLIAYSDRSAVHTTGVWLIRPNGTGRVRLFSQPRAKPQADIYAVSWSPDAKALAVVTTDGELYVVPTDGGRPRRLHTGVSFDAAWSPRSNEIAYASPAGEIRAVASDGSRRPRVVAANRGCFLPLWSSDGHRLAAACGDARGRYAYIYVMNADGRRLRRLTKHANNDFGFAWSPDGQSILYGREHRQGIYVIGANGGNDHMVTSDSPPETSWGALAWAADGRSIAYTTDRTGRGDLYVIGTNGRNKLRLTRSSESDFDPAWARSTS